MNNNECKNILDTLSLMHTKRHFQIINLLHNRINVMFGYFRLFKGNKLYETNGLYDKYVRIINDIIKMSYTSTPISIVSLVGINAKFKDIVPKRCTFEQLKILIDINNV